MEVAPEAEDFRFRI